MSDVQLAVPPAFRRAVRVRLARLDAEGFTARLERRDPSLWGTDPGRQAVARTRLGWLDAPTTFRAQTGAFRDFATEVVADGFREAVLLGMGGSSLAPEVFAAVLGPAPGALSLTVHDRTSPRAVRELLETRDPQRTLFIVASKSGTTAEVTALERAVFEWTWAGRPRAGTAFVAITDPGTPLEQLARERSYRRVFLNPADIGGRYSALSCFGLVPGGLIGADLDAVLDTAIAERRLVSPETPADRIPALILGATLGELALAGRDKVTLLLDEPLAPLGDWIEQLLAESTGKHGRGLIPVVGEEPGPAESYRKDRVFVAVSIGEHASPLAAALDRLRRAGHPVLAWVRGTTEDLGAEFMRWEIATTVAARVLDVDPFDEPNVAEAKQATQQLLLAARDGLSLPLPEPLARKEGLAAAAPAAFAEALARRVSDPSDPVAWAAAWPLLARPGDYIALLPFLNPGPDVDGRLRRLRRTLHEATRLPVTLGYGPRYLHSTGQLHKGGPERGLFVQFVADEGDATLPGERFGFGTFQQAQALGDYHVLERRRRRVLRLDLGADPESGLDRLLDPWSAAARV